MKLGRRIAGLVAFAVVLSTVPMMAGAALTFGERAKAQEAIERVYYAHQIWPKENPGPKPSFEEAVPRSVLEAKVTDYLKKSAAMEKFWQRPITGEQLQAEMERMVKGSRTPAVLRELFAALDNDPNLIAECLARPILADRLIHNWYAYDSRFHGEMKSKADAALAAGPAAWTTCDEGEYRFSEVELEREGEVREAEEAGASSTPDRLPQEQFDRWAREVPPAGQVRLKETDEAFVLMHTVALDGEKWSGNILTLRKNGFSQWWQSEKDDLNASDSLASQDYEFHVPETSAGTESCTIQEGWDYETSLAVPDGRSWSAMVWTGSKAIVWGGGDSTGAVTATGGQYDPATDTWAATSTGANCPSGRRYFTAVWSGTEMIAWGGYDGTSDFNTGGRYNPLLDTWTATSTGTNCPAVRRSHVAVWTSGSKMIVWGGIDGSTYYNTGGQYDPSANTWTATNTTGAPAGRHTASAVWTGSKMIVWGGSPGGSSGVNTGGQYDPMANSWTGTSTGTNCPSARWYHRAVWTGSRMIVWGGTSNGTAALNTGGQYDPVGNSWATTSTGTNCPTARYYHTVVWTGSALVVWGGYNGTSSFNSGGRYDPTANSWTVTSTDTNCPSTRYTHTAIWDDRDAKMIVWGGNGLNTGGQYDPTTDTWTPTSVGSGAPSARNRHTAVWTGSKMIIWGGWDNTNYFNTGGQYDPATDAWAATSTGTNCPSVRAYQREAWTGSLMIVWGGYDGTSYLNTGGKYDPVADTWAATTTTSVPAGRYVHTMVWTGSTAIVWGGANAAYLSTGGLYDPVANSWTATATTGAPSVRQNHTAVWTGNEMVVWGGYNGTSYLNTGSKYNPSGSGTWTATPTAAPCPSARNRQTAVWTGSQMVVWGGDNGTTYYNTGAKYDPGTNTWFAATSTGSNCPSVRDFHKAVWTGSRMVVWGGYNGTATLNTGGRYDPVADTWTATSTDANCPSERQAASAVWTGESMIVWGGNATSGASATATGGIYRTGDIVISGPSSGCGSITLTAATSYADYQWMKNGGDIPGATSQSYQATSSGSYSLRVDDTSGCIGTSASFPVTVWPFAFSTQPSDQALCPGGNTSFSVAATGDGLAYQWQVSTNGGTSWASLSNDSTYSGVTTSTLSVTAVTTGMNGYLYRCSLTGTYCSGASSAARLTTQATITLNPSNLSVCNGDSADFWVNALGYGLTYQWQVSSDGGSTYGNLAEGSPYYGTTGSHLSIIPAPYSLTGTYFRCIATSSCGSTAYSSGALLTVSPLTRPTQPVISAITDLSPSSLTGIQITYTPGSGATRQDLYKDGGVAVTGYASGATYQPGDSVTHCYAVLAFNSGCDTISNWVNGTDVNGTAPGPPVIISAADISPSQLTGVQIAYTLDSGATSHDLYKDGYLAVSGYVSGARYKPGDGQVHSYAVVANHPCFDQSSNAVPCRDAYGTQPGSPAITAITDLDPNQLTGIQITYAPGFLATRHDLYRDGVLAVSIYASGATYYPGDSANHSYVIRAVNGTYGADSNAMSGTDAIPTAPGAPTITGITDVNPSLVSGIRIAYTAGSGATSHDLYKDGALAVAGYTSNAIYGPCDNASHTYAVRAIKGALHTDSASTAASDAGAISPSEVAPGTSKPVAMTMPDKSTITWPVNTTACSYTFYRGVLAGLPQLLTGSTNACNRYQGAATSVAVSESPTGVAGHFYWYLVTGTMGGSEGPAGNATAGPRTVNSSGTCP